MDPIDFFTSNLFTTLLILTSFIIGLHLHNYFFWKRCNIPFLRPNYFEERYLQKENVGFKLKHFHDDIRAKGWQHGGIALIHLPVYIPVDLDIIKSILTKDFEYFGERIVYSNEKSDPLSVNLPSLNGERWRIMRTKLTPTFTSAKMRSIFQSLLGCSSNLLEKVGSYVGGDQPIDIKDALDCFTTDTIGSCAFGLECDSFKENALFRKYGKDFFVMTPRKLFEMSLALLSPSAAKFLGVTYTDKDLTDFFLKTVVDTITFRENTNYRRQDFMQIMIDLKNGSEGSFLTNTEIAALCFNFFTAGFEPSSAAITFALYELSRDVDCQARVRREISKILGEDQEVTYEAIQSIKYLDQVVCETLRLYPPASILFRRCTKDYKFQDGDAIIKKDTAILVSLLGIHRDAEHYPDPEKFDPERFNDENKKGRHKYAYIPFGEGPRNCIGYRFALLQIKVALVMLLKNFKFTVNEKTQEPLKTKPETMGLVVEGGVWLNVERV